MSRLWRTDGRWKILIRYQSSWGWWEIWWNDDIGHENDKRWFDSQIQIALAATLLNSYSPACLLITLPYQHSKLALQEWTVHIRSRVKIASNPQPPPPPYPPRSELLGILIPPLVSAAHPPWIEASHLNSHTSVRLNFELRFLISYYRSSCCVCISGNDFTPNYLNFKFKFHDKKLANPN